LPAVVRSGDGQARRVVAHRSWVGGAVARVQAIGRGLRRHEVHLGRQLRVGAAQRVCREAGGPQVSGRGFSSSGPSRRWRWRDAAQARHRPRPSTGCKPRVAASRTSQASADRRPRVTAGCTPRAAAGRERPRGHSRHTTRRSRSGVVRAGGHFRTTISGSRSPTSRSPAGSARRLVRSIRYWCN
jgi:hypothetical protein